MRFYQCPYSGKALDLDHVLVVHEIDSETPYRFYVTLAFGSRIELLVTTNWTVDTPKTAAQRAAAMREALIAAWRGE